MVAEPIYFEQTASEVTGRPRSVQFYRRVVVRTTPRPGQESSDEETSAIERDVELYHRVLTRRRSSTDIMSVDELFNLAADV
jgi:hypothetical protein